MREAQRVSLGEVSELRRVAYFFRDGQGQEVPRLGVLIYKEGDQGDVVALRGLRAVGSFRMALTEQVIDLGPEVRIKGPGHNPLPPGIKP